MSLESQHDQKVRRIAAGYLGMGYSVRADLPDWERPKPIRRRIPDVVAVRGKTTKIVEVETDSTQRSHRDQRAIFKDYALGRRRTRFRWTRA